MKIAQCLEYPIQQHGGTEVLVRELVRGLAGRHEIVLVSDDDDESWRRSSVGALVREHIPWRPGSTLEEAKKLAAQLQAQQIDLAHFHFGGTYAWGSRRWNFAPPIHLHRLGVPCLATNHGVFGVLDGYIGPQRSLLTKLACLPAAWASRLQLIAHLEAEVAVSMNDYRALRRRFWPQGGKFRQIYHSRLHESEASGPRAAVDRKKTILCVGTLGPRKGQPYLARAFAQIAGAFPDWKLVFIGRPGDSGMAAELHALMARPELQGRIQWVTRCTDGELQAWFQSVEIYAMPSLDEGLGLTLQEALYHGCACIASRIGGIPDLIQHDDNGLLVERANVPALAAGLSRLLGEAALRERLRLRGRASVLEKNMLAERMVARYEQLYAAVMK